MKQLFASNKKFRLFLLSGIVSNAGDYIDDIAFAQLVYITTKSTLLSSYVFAIKIVFSVVSIFSATLADKLSKKIMIVISCMAQGILLIFLLLAYQQSYLSTVGLMLFVTLQAIFSSFVRPAQNAILPLIVDKDSLIEARSLMGISDQLIQMFAYLASAILISKIGIVGALLFDTFSFITMAIAFSFIDIKEKVTPIKSANEFWNNVRDGFSFVRNEKIILIIMLLTFGGNFLVMPIDTLMPAYISQMKYSITFFSVYMLIMAIGGVVGGSMITKLRNTIPLGKLFTLGYLFGSLSLLFLGIRTEYIFFLSAFFMGLSTAIVSILNSSMIQILTPKEMSARVFAIFKCISYVASPIGILMAGIMGEFISMKKIYPLYGIIMLLLTWISLKSCRINSDIVN